MRPMKRRILLASAATMGVVFLAAPVNAQGVQQTVPIAKVDVQTVAAGYRASKVIGSSVLNEANETIGKIDDLLVTRDAKEPYAVLSIGGFLGIGTHLVVVRYDSLGLHQQDRAAGRDEGGAYNAACIRIRQTVIVVDLESIQD
jgi:hypothetical protein